MTNNDHLMKILLAPLMSEKSTTLASLGQYVFRVTKDSNKPEIKQAVEMLFNVKVKNVRISNVKAKAKRFGQIQGQHRGWKKAYISLQEGHKIKLMDAQA